MKKILILIAVIGISGIISAAPQIVIDRTARLKQTVSINVANPTYAKCLRRNLELSGLFEVKSSGAITVSGGSGAVSVSGAGKSFSSPAAFTDDASARMAARRLSDMMCESFGGQKGFACDPIVFVSKDVRSSELCMCYPDGGDIRQISHDKQVSIDPHWKNANTVLYTGYLSGRPQIWERDVNTGKAKLMQSFKNLATGAVLSPDGTKIAVILSFQGNPELYVIDVATRNWVRLTNTPHANEGCPSWSPDGKKLVFVSDDTRSQHLYIIDIATKAKRRVTSKGSSNVEPDWGKDGRIAYITKRGGLSQIAIMEPADGDASAVLVGKAGSWKEPSWSRDMRHIVASRDKALFIVDTMENGDEPRQLFMNIGNWIMPCWTR